MTDSRRRDVYARQRGEQARATIPPAMTARQERRYLKKSRRNAAATCGARYERKPRPERGDRIVRCGLPHPHLDLDHEEFIDGEPSGNTWPMTVDEIIGAL